MASRTTDLRQNRIACFVMFGVQGFAFSLLVSRVPAIQKQLHLDDGTLSILLAVIPVVAGVGSLLAGLAMRWTSSSTLLRIAEPAVILTLVAVPHTRNLWQAMPVLAVFGLAVGCADATMNMQAVGLERRYGRSIILGFFGVWAAGAILGSSWAALGASLGWHLSEVYLTGAVVGVVFALAAGPYLLRGLGDETIAKTADGKVPHIPWRPMALLCVVMTLTYIGESTVSNAGGDYLTKGLKSTDALSALVVGAYTLGQVLGRIRGDKLVQRYGAVLTVRVGALIGLGGFLVVIAAVDPYMALAGFLVTGLGLSVLVPQAFAAADRTDPNGTGVAVARINVFNYLGFLLGAPLVTGLWGAGVSHREGMAIPAVMIAGIIVLAKAFDPKRTSVPAVGTPVTGAPDAVPTLGT